jgi:maltose alpha-D-glucosyltransferase / alpha-amylase
VAMMQQLVESQADGWRHATEELSRFYDRIEGRDSPRDPLPATFADMIAARPPIPVVELMTGYLETALTLGRRTGELHLALASDARDPAFAPEPFTKDDLLAVAADATAQIQHAMEALQERVDRSTRGAKKAARVAVSDEIAAEAKELLRARGPLLDSLRRVPTLEFTASKTRIHGDYHLGQVLWSEGDFYILDFEGEPARPLAMRRQKQSPMKDVAGMLRSFSYAAYAGLFAHTVSRPSEYARLEAWARLWQTWAGASFLRGYFESAGQALFVPTEPSQRDALLRLFVIDKALYELNYELNNRPDWVRIPLRGLLELIQSE